MVNAVNFAANIDQDNQKECFEFIVPHPARDGFDDLRDVDRATNDWVLCARIFVDEAAAANKLTAQSI